MFEKILPVILVLVLLQLLIRFMQRRKLKVQSHASSRFSEYRDKIDRLMKIDNFNGRKDIESVIESEIRSGIASPELLMQIPENMRDVRRGLNLIIEGVNHGVKAKTGSLPDDVTKFRDASLMFDELVEVVKKHQVG